MRHKYGLQLDIRFKSHPFKQVRQEILVGVALESPPQKGQVEMCLNGQRHVERHRTLRSLEREIPDASPRPRMQRFLSESNRRRPQELAACMLRRMLFYAHKLIERPRQPRVDPPLRGLLEQLDSGAHTVWRGSGELGRHAW